MRLSSVCQITGAVFAGISLIGALESQAALITFTDLGLNQTFNETKYTLAAGKTTGNAAPYVSPTSSPYKPLDRPVTLTISGFRTNSSNTFLTSSEHTVSILGGTTRRVLVGNSGTNVNTTNSTTGLAKIAFSEAVYVPRLFVSNGTHLGRNDIFTVKAFAVDGSTESYTYGRSDVNDPAAFPILTYLTVNFTSGNPITKLEFSDYVFNRYVDDITINSVPEPSALALFAIGGSMLLRRRRRVTTEL